jgi:hypothetical protein
MCFSLTISSFAFATELDPVSVESINEDSNVIEIIEAEEEQADVSVPSIEEENSQESSGEKEATATDLEAPEESQPEQEKVEEETEVKEDVEKEAEGETKKENKKKASDNTQSKNESKKTNKSTKSKTNSAKAKKSTKKISKKKKKKTKYLPYTEEGKGAIALTEDGQLVDISGAYKDKNGEPTKVLKTMSNIVHRTSNVHFDDENHVSKNNNIKKVISKCKSIAHRLENHGWKYEKGIDVFTYSEAKDKKKLDCAKYTSIVMQESENLPKKHTFYTDKKGELVNSHKGYDTKAKIKEKFNVYSKSSKGKDLANWLKPGDIVGISSHTMIYAGKVGDSLFWWSAGKDACDSEMTFKWICQYNPKYQKEKILKVLRLKKA